MLNPNDDRSSGIWIIMNWTLYFDYNPFLLIEHCNDDDTKKQSNYPIKLHKPIFVVSSPFDQKSPNFPAHCTMPRINTRQPILTIFLIIFATMKYRKPSRWGSKLKFWRVSPASMSSCQFSPIQSEELKPSHNNVSSTILHSERRLHLGKFFCTAIKALLQLV